MTRSPTTPGHGGPLIVRITSDESSHYNESLSSTSPWRSARSRSVRWPARSNRSPPGVTALPCRQATSTSQFEHTSLNSKAVDMRRRSSRNVRSNACAREASSVPGHRWHDSDDARTWSRDQDAGAADPGKRCRRPRGVARDVIGVECELLPSARLRRRGSCRDPRRWTRCVGHGAPAGRAPSLRPHPSSSPVAGPTQHTPFG